ncbi:hypothetical protein ACWCPI_15330 [Streptomyces sp. NPDC001920]
MSHRIAITLLRTPLSRLLRRRGHHTSRVRPGVVVAGPTVRHTGPYTSRERAPRVAVPGIGFGSCGIPQECTVIIRGKAS